MNTTTVDTATIGQLLVEGLELVGRHAGVAGDGDLSLSEYLGANNVLGDAIPALARLAQTANDMLELKEVVSDPKTHVRVSIADNALSGLLSLFGTAV